MLRLVVTPVSLSLELMDGHCGGLGWESEMGARGVQEAGKCSYV